MSLFDVVALGEPLYELNRQPDGNWLTGFGGDTLNVAIAARRLGSRTAYVTRLGDDVFGEELHALMLREAVDTTAVATDAGAPTGLYFVTHGPAGHVFTYRRAGSAASRMTPSELDPARIASARFLHASGISQAISESAAETVSAAIAMARKAGVGVSYDTNFRPRLWTAEQARPVITAAAGQADVLKTSAEDAEALFGLTQPAEIGRLLLGLGAKAVVITLGRDGVTLVTRDGVERVAGRAVAAVDATGAGDAFTGALISELATGKTLAAAARFANAAAALSTLGYGAIAPLAHRAAVEGFLQSSD